MGGFLTTCARISVLPIIFRRKEGPIADGGIPYDLRTHQRASYYITPHPITAIEQQRKFLTIMFLYGIILYRNIICVF